ncbi:type II secretion system protein [Thalassotalea euphylliae]|uniref:type II secretion system protein n=1 Tax=Thalassotalea euphylliae TaxID=1655234 RepID=UPI00363D320F
MKKQTGFTLIELVIVVVILGFLAVTAIPKFLDLTDQAQEANIEGMAGGFATAVSLVRAQWEAEGRPQNAGGDNAVIYDGQEIILTEEAATVRPGYPYSVGGTGNPVGGVMNTTRCEEVWQNIFSQPPQTAITVGALNADTSTQYLVDIVNGDTICAYYLKETLTRDANGDFQDPGGLTTVGNLFTYDPKNSSVVVYVNN